MCLAFGSTCVEATVVVCTLPCLLEEENVKYHVSLIVLR